VSEHVRYAVKYELPEKLAHDRAGWYWYGSHTGNHRVPDGATLYCHPGPAKARVTFYRRRGFNAEVVPVTCQVP